MKQLQDIQADFVRLANANASDLNLMGQITTDANDAIRIIASKKFWTELVRTESITTSSTDGDMSYPLDVNVDRVDQVKIVSPTDYASVLQYIPRRLLRDIVPSKLLIGNSVPNKWYFSEPIINSDNSATKTMSFNVMPDRTYTINYTFKSLPPNLVQPTDVPFFNSNFHQIILPYCLYQYAINQADPTLDPIFFYTQWQNGLNELLSNDDTDLVVNSPIQADYKTVGL